MSRFDGLRLGIFSLAIYVAGGLLAFTGIALILFMGGRDLFGWGEGRTLGYLFLCVGLCFSILGVLLMRIFRNRGVA